MAQPTKSKHSYEIDMVLRYGQPTDLHSSIAMSSVLLCISFLAVLNIWFAFLAAAKHWADIFMKLPIIAPRPHCNSSPFFLLPRETLYHQENFTSLLTSHFPGHLWMCGKAQVTEHSCRWVTSFLCRNWPLPQTFCFLSMNYLYLSRLSLLYHGCLVSLEASGEGICQNL